MNSFFLHVLLEMFDIQISGVVNGYFFEITSQVQFQHAAVKAHYYFLNVSFKNIDAE